MALGLLALIAPAAPPPPRSATPRVLRWIGGGALALLVLELLLLPRLVGIDAAVWRAVLLCRACGTDRLVDRTVEVVTRITILLLIAATVSSVRRVGARATWPPLAVCAVGLLAGKVLKNAFARERPSILPGVAIGHSFPSGHVMNTALAALAVAVLAASSRRPRGWWVAAATLLALIASGRVLQGHHWFLDALGGALAATALMGLCLAPFRRRPFLAPTLLALALAAVLTIDLHVRALAVQLPSPLMPRERTMVELRPAELLGSAALAGTWIAPAASGRERPFTWLEGRGVVRFEVPADRTPQPRDPRPLPRGAEAMIGIGGRPDITSRRCLSMRVSVDDRVLASFVPYVGWREYRFAVPRGTLRNGANALTIEVRDDRGGAWRFGVAYVRIDLD